jgi:hypothetical protein
MKHAGITVSGNKGSQMSLSVRKVSGAIVVGCAAAVALGAAGVPVTAQSASGASSLAFVGRHHWGDDDGDHNHYDHNRYDHSNNHNRYGDDGLIVLDLL